MPAFMFHTYARTSVTAKVHQSMKSEQVAIQQNICKCAQLLCFSIKLQFKYVLLNAYLSKVVTRTVGLALSVSKHLHKCAQLLYYYIIMLLYKLGLKNS